MDTALWCDGCAHALRPNARFCGDCGTAVAGGAGVAGSLAAEPGPAVSWAAGGWAAASAPAAGVPYVPPQPRPSDVLDSAREREPRRRRRVLLATAAAAVTVGVTAGAVYAVGLLSGGGAQPEDVLPAEAVALVKVDLDPAAGQKLAVYELAQQFPDSGVRDSASVKDDLLRTLLPEADQRADYDANVRPWLGDRAGLALLPPASSSEEPVVVAAVQYRDRAAAEQGLRQLADEAAAESGGDELHYAFADGEDYVLLSDDRAAVDRAARQQEHLADNPQFDRGVQALGGDQIALGWMDLGAAWRLVPESERSDVSVPGQELDVSGLAVFGASAADGTVEVIGKTVDVSAGSSEFARRLDDNAVGVPASTGLLTRLPEDTQAAFSVTGLGEGLASLYESLPADLREDVEPAGESLGLALPEDLPALLGTEAAVALSGDLVAGDPQVELRVDSPDGARAVELLRGLQRMLAGQAPEQAQRVALAQTGTGYVATYGRETSTAGRRLGDSEVFRRTLPDADRSGLSYYVDVARLVQRASATPAAGELSDRERRNLEAVQAAGLTTTVEGGGNATMRLRVTIRR